MSLRQQKINEIATKRLQKQIKTDREKKLDQDIEKTKNDRIMKAGAKIIKDSGIYGAHQELMNTLFLKGFPQGNIYEFCALEIEKSHRKLQGLKKREMIERVKARESSKAKKTNLKLTSKSKAKLGKQISDVTSTILLNTPGPQMSTIDQGSLKMVSSFDSNQIYRANSQEELFADASMITDYKVMGTPNDQNIIIEESSELEATLQNFSKTADPLTIDRTYDNPNYENNIKIENQEFRKKQRRPKVKVENNILLEGEEIDDYFSQYHEVTSSVESIITSKTRGMISESPTEKTISNRILKTGKTIEINGYKILE